MPKNTKGGKKHKKYKKETDCQNKEILLVENGGEQFYALVTKHYGNGRVQVTYINSEGKAIDSLGNIRGKFRRRKGANFVNINNIVIISEREFDKDKCDIIHVYKPDEIITLRNRGVFNSKLVPNDSKFQEDDFEFKDFEDENDSYVKPKNPSGLGKNNIVKDNYGIESSDEEDLK